MEQLIEQRFAALTAEQVVERLERAAIANARSNTGGDSLAHEHLHARGRVRKVGFSGGPVTSFLPAVTIPGMEPVMGPVPGVGEHTQAILAELGLAGDDAP
jgi:itaconate CoA-transferase